jgi:hypothetical protein
MKKRSAKSAAAGKSSRSKSASPRSRSSDKPSTPSTASPFPSEWSEFIGLLCAHRAKFLIVGAHALAVLAHVRATKDLDILVEPTKQNAKRVCAALADFGFKALAAQHEEFARNDRMATLGVEPLRIDIMNGGHPRFPRSMSHFLAHGRTACWRDSAATKSESSVARNSSRTSVRRDGRRTLRMSQR